ncbi:hypothetical protein [Candidatus Contendibacter odensensis]|uniref:Uncharacterized protein n=1 Tax=Candidatus Contendobacter odensis Run_B_J11 TaxID=1400861 RepID=A0A7U7J5C2_9GAMM|nr:hypothetical protein [Candidatus Contendobacter odensis]CDH46612.1 hypothetical protein BN874_530041 [Candidatus Contendobacter odensis Run_B_J11]
MKSYTDVGFVNAVNASISAIDNAEIAFRILIEAIKSRIELVEWEERLIFFYANAFKALQLGFLEMVQKARKTERNFNKAYNAYLSVYDVYMRAFELVEDCRDTEIVQSNHKAAINLMGALGLYHSILLGNDSSVIEHQITTKRLG